MIFIHTGVLPQEVTEKGLELGDPKDYPNIRLAIRGVQSPGQDCHVYVKHRACDNWFWDLGDYGSAQLINDDPRERLRRKLKLAALSPDLDSHPDRILELGLLELPAPQKLESDVWTWILNEKLGIIWSQAEPSFDHLASLVQWYLKNATIMTSLPIVLKQRQQLAKERWIAEAKGQLQSAYELFWENPPNSSAFLASWQNLEKHYPDELEPWLKEEGWYNPSLTWVSFKMPALPVSTGIQSRLSPKVRAYWIGRLSKGEHGLDESLMQMSGLLLGELEAIENCLRRGVISVDRLQVEKIRTEFVNLPSAATIVESISTEVPPNQITEPDPTWATDSWISWAIKQYIPYKKWLIDHGSEVSIISRYSSLYEEWLFANYPTFARKVDNLVYASYKLIEPLLRNGSTVIWVLVDNLPIFWHDALSKIFSNGGFLRPVPPAYLLSMLPSETSTCRPSILTGKLPNQAMNANTEQAFEDEWRKRGTVAKVSHSIDELTRHVREGGELFMLNYNTLDFLAHQADYELTNREDMVNFHLTSLCRSLHEVMKQITEVRPAKLVISSDHGSTKIPKNAQSVPIPLSAQLDEVLKLHSRFARVTHFQSLNPLEWFFLEDETFGLSENYAIVKGNRYVGTRPLGYTHGGMSPEETITALSVWQLGQIPAENEISVFQASPPIVRGRPQQITINVRNPFAFDITHLNIFLPTIGAHFEADRVLAQAEATLGPAEVRLPPKCPVVNSVSEFDMVISYEVAGHMKQRVTRFQIKIRELFRSMLDDVETIP